MIRILCHSIGIYLTLFPGIIMFFIKERSLRSYCYALTIPIIINVLIFSDYKLLLLILTIITAPILIYYIEKSIHIKRIYKNIDKNISTGLLIIGIIPILEEFIFKYYLFEYISVIFSLNVCVEGIIFIVINAIVFIIAHISTQKQKALIKIVFAIISSTIFILIKNIYICIIIHSIFNAIVYISTISKYSGRIN